MFRSRDDRRRGLGLPWLLYCAAVLLPRGMSAGAPSGPGYAYEPVGNPQPPVVEDSEWSKEPIDAFVRLALAEKGLRPAPPVDRRAWLRRVTFDLIGLPPRPDEVEAFLADPRSDEDARASRVDRLLASSEYGVRWARHWLDVVRYADSDGFAIDSERPTLWRYRDYIVRSFNEDRPFDQLVREQIAGDLGDGGAQGLVATGFFRLGPWEADNMVAEIRRQDFLNEVTSAVGTVFLGLSFACARCHDHKYDPIPTRDFYRLQAFFTPFERDDRAASLAEVERTALVNSGSEMARKNGDRLRQELETVRAGLKAKLSQAPGAATAPVTDAALDAALKDEKTFTKEEKARLESLKKAVTEYPDEKRYADAAVTIREAEKSSRRAPTRILLGGNVTAPGEEVAPGFPTAVKTESTSAARLLDESGANAPGSRRALAEWLASPDNPLVPRVFMNRVWQYHFGVGIVATSNDFGRNGSGPSHPKLLDYLARRFIDGGFRLKSLHREIVLSRAYRTSTVHPDSAACERVDPENRLLWRSHYRRLEAEEVRDALLAVSGRLLLDQGGPGFYEELPEELGRSFPFFDWNPSSERERRRRSLYIFQRRNLVVPMLEAFDAADASQPCDRRRPSVTAPQVLSLLNGKLSNDSARHFARRVIDEVGDDPRKQVQRAFLLAFGRPPSADELDACVAAMDEKAERERIEPAGSRGKIELAELSIAPLTNLCLVLFNANEFLYLE